MIELARLSHLSDLRHKLTRDLEKVAGADPVLMQISFTVLKKLDDEIDEAEHGLDGTPEGFLKAVLALQGDDPIPTDDPIIAVDLDGTLAVEDGPFDASHIGDPRPDAVEWVKRFKEAGAYIVIHTVRGDDETTAAWLDEHDVPWDDINRSPRQPPGSSSKLFADVYLDNRAIDASGAWAAFGPEVMSRIRSKKQETE